ncbi:calcium channel subunit mid1 [Niveomyces insectorum RCEF 264]|uniref:Calcium channel subunit mid1 n=1 Tax=Niveomyces insectorum RCEF 264 TaxID=1081102 RepID=A0A167X4S3_9HYPO|nr:calcium channel subunit mid1 [Niveomyces insectorum RCEF 264]
MASDSLGLPRRRRSGAVVRNRTSATTVFLFLFLFFLSLPYAAEATADVDFEASPLPPKDVGSNFIRDWFRAAIDREEGDNESGVDGTQPDIYEPSFSAFDRSIIGRAPPGVTSLANNAPEQLNVEPGTTQVFVFEKASIFGRHVNDVAETEAYFSELRRKRDEQLQAEGREQDDGEAEREANEDGEETTAGSTHERLLPKRQQGNNATARTIYLSANTCIQPQLLSETITGNAPQLTMYVSTTPENIAPGPHANAGQQTWHVFSEGAVMVSVNATDDVYVGIAAPNISTTMLSGTYNFQLAASVDGWYHSYDNETDANLIWVDSDARAALLYTHNLTESTDGITDASIMDRQPYVMFAQNADDRSADGVRFSYCGLQTYAQIAATNNGKFTSMVETGMTRAGLGNLPKQQFYFSGLNASSNYLGILAALPANGTTGGGGQVARATRFATKAADATCEVIFNLTFCNETAYAVPSNPARFAAAADLARVYDEYAAGMFANFLNVLAQIPCEAPSTQQYSLVRTCADCRAAYKTWLCSVAIPRCSDFADNATWLQPRAISQPFPDGTRLDPAVAAQYPNTTAFNSSRNPFIDATVAPGPYKEVLPCDDLCYGLVQSCPSAIGFSCPVPGQIGFNTSYGLRTAADNDGSVTCNYPGSAHYFSAGPTARPRLLWIVLAVAGSFVAAVLM